jgi:O6-methylguanine-DNA--protein-cysteine methyltransferase
LSDEVTAPVTTGTPSGDGGGSSPSASWSDTQLKAREWLANNPVTETETQTTPAATSQPEASPNTTTKVDPEPTPPAAEETPLVPSFRLREEAEKRREAERQLEQFGPYRGVIETLQARGMTPEQISGFLATVQGDNPLETTPEPAAAPALSQEERFEKYLEAANVDPDTASPETLAALERAFIAEENLAAEKARIDALEGRFREIDEATAEREQRAIEASLEAEMKTVCTKYPALHNPDFQMSIYATFAMEASQPGSTVTLTEIAERFGQGLDAYTRNAVGEYAAKKQADGSVPVAAGGTAAPPAPSGTVYDKGVKRDERIARVTEFLRSKTSTG